MFDAMKCAERDRIEEHLIDIRELVEVESLTEEHHAAAAHALAFAATLLKEHEEHGHNGQPCPARASL